MTNTSNHNTDPSDKQRSDLSDLLPESSTEENLHNRFLQDISSIKHIPELKEIDKEKNNITLIEAIFNATIIRTLSDTVREFRALGSNFINRSVLFGLSKEFGQSPYISALKGEIKEGGEPANMALQQRMARLQSDKEAKEKNQQNIKKVGNEVRINKDDKDKSHTHETLSKNESEDKKQLLEENKVERIPNEDNEPNKERYNISETILKASELELSMLQSGDKQQSLFKNLEHTKPTDTGGSTLTKKNIALSTERLKQCIEKFSQGKILVIGDLLIDELLEGRPERISREAPVLILEHMDTVLIPGGAANTAHNVTALSGQCQAVGIIGQDEYAQKLIALLDKHGIKHGLVVDSSRPTTVKTRILSKTHAMMQQLLRMDRISHEPVSATIEASLIAKLESIAKQYQVIILSDYRGGIMTDGIIHACKNIAAQLEIMLIVDAQDQFERFQNVTLLTPNQPDAEKAVGFKINNEADLLQAGSDMLLLTGAQHILITRGKEGMSLFNHDNVPFHLPAFNRSEVFDVSGAGDTVVATIALALATGASFPEAVALGNIAASIVVKKSGTAVTNQKEMLDLLPLIKLPI